MIRTALTENGRVRGLPAADPRITSWKGIPYAAPPVGINRWRAPQPCPDWEGERECYAFSPIPMQAPIRADPRSLYDREWHVDRDIPMGEDCLTLNVWAPADGGRKLPVFVWFYGGGLQVGYTAEMEFDGERIARRGIVVVTVNYRLNVFGFLSHPELSAEDPSAPANFGFLDQQAALRWVQRNISAFGGDPACVTVGGQSAGGMSVSAQMTCPANAGLFQRAIIQSGTFLSPYPAAFGLCADRETAEEQGEKFFDHLGVKSLAEARQLDAVTLRDAALKWDGVHGWGNTFGETVDGVFSFRNSREWFLDPHRIRVPVLLGHTVSEFIRRPDLERDASAEAYARRLFGERAEEFLSLFDPPTTFRIQEDGGINMIEFAVRAAARALSEDGGGEELYYYVFDGDIPGEDHPGAFHSSDLWFFFETLAKCRRPFTGKHYDLARQMCDYWCNFIRTGDPNGADLNGEALPAWPALDLADPVRMRFADTAAAEGCPESRLTSFLLDRFFEGREG